MSESLMDTLPTGPVGTTAQVDDRGGDRTEGEVRTKRSGWLSEVNSGRTRRRNRRGRGGRRRFMVGALVRDVSDLLDRGDVSGCV